MAANSDTRFSIAFNHGGQFTVIGVDRLYVGGAITSSFDLDSSSFGYEDLGFEVEMVGYVSWKRLYYKVPNTMIYKDVNSDAEVIEMLSHLDEYCRVIQVFVDGGLMGRGIEDSQVVDLQRKESECWDDYEPEVEIVDESNGKYKGKGVDADKGKGIEVNVEDEDYKSAEDSDYIANPEVEGDYSDDDLEDDDLEADEEYSNARKLLREKTGMGLCDEAFAEVGEECGFSDYEDADGDIYTSETDEDSDRVRRRIRRVVYDPRTEHKDLKLEIGMRFADGYEAREAIREYSIADGRDVRFTRVFKGMMEANCSACKWRAYGSLVQATGHFIIKTLDGNHTCSMALRNRQVTSTWIAKKYLNVIRYRPDITVKEMAMDIRQRFNCHVVNWKLYKARSKAIDMLRGTVKEHYAKLRSYILELKRVDPDGRFDLNCDIGAVFKGIYVGFSALRKGFKAGCRRVIGLDGAFLKTYLGGVLLCAVATDANNQMFPIAWAVVEVENNENWRWFMRILVDDVGIFTGVGFTFISDQQKGLLNAVAEVTPFATHRNCARHVYMNWKKGHKAETVKKIFWRTVRSTYLQDYNAALDEMKRQSAAAYEDFIGRDTTKFCKCFIEPGSVSDMILNNISETFNGYILAARGKHVIHMLEEIRTSLMEILHRKKREFIGYSHAICPEIMKDLEKIKSFSRYCMVNVASDVLFEVENYADRFIVDVQLRTCTCRAWDISGIPCIHACAAIIYMRKDPVTYVNEWYSMEKHQAIYLHSMPALNGEKLWPIAEGYAVVPPAAKKMPGRQKKKRKRDPCEENPKNPTKLRRNGSTMTCSNCQKQGHNRRSCKQDPVVKGPKAQGKLGRHKKNPQGNNTNEVSTSTLPHANEASTITNTNIRQTMAVDGSGSVPPIPPKKKTRKNTKKKLNVTQESKI